jgi:hypothetical protein
MAHTKKDDFTKNFELGVSLDLPKEGEEDVLILYSDKKAMPDKLKRQSSSSGDSAIEFLSSTKEAVENCDYLNMIFAHHDDNPRRNQCWAILPQVRFGEISCGFFNFIFSVGLCQINHVDS